jgi:hypothetical protein
MWVYGKQQALLGIMSKQAKKFGVKWLESKRNEAHDLWERRNSLKHNSKEVDLALLGELRSKLKNLVLLRRKAGLHTLTNEQYIKLSRNKLKLLIISYEAEEAISIASQPSILESLQNNGLDAQAADQFAARTDTINNFATARAKARKRRCKNAASQKAVTRIDSIFDQDDSDDSEEEIDLNGSSAEAIAVVTDYINNASLNSNIDQEAVLNISAMVEGMMLQDREEWEL